MATTLRVDVQIALEAFYKDGKHRFWPVFDETAVQAVEAFKTRPESFGVVATDYGLRNRTREHARILAMMALLLESVTRPQ